MNKKELKKKFKADQKKLEKSKFPVSEEKLKNLFDYLDKMLSDFSCEHDYHFTSEFIKNSEVEKGNLLLRT